ncbi:MAG: alanyl-tRNA editing protein [Rhodobacteraceae bacterium]|jgi:misacylated tRNA(Ala) deacylase|nr:alanyl-tRNA editing protein [Paracoccaceae bacterium]MBL4557119.1 alanyl-tRNA editing protein [Paracoccaceae bacterium]HBG97921.1 Ala-tRNA(Pro) hydrolase [Paracoccaceae bacterium]
MSMAPMYRIDPYRRSAPGRVVSVSAAGVRVDPPLFYPTGGGQPGDTGRLVWPGGAAEVIDTVKGADGASLLFLAEGAMPPAEGTEVTQELDWERRFAHMRAHTALHLLSVVIPLPVTGGAITEEKGRLDFDMPEAPEDRDALEAALNALVARDLPVTEDWISDAELAANPALVKTMSVAPPRGQGHVRLIRVGDGETQVDLQPCGGTHVARTGEIGRLRIGKIEKKGKANRRVNVHLVE